jgi:translation initiation factor IF-3
MFRLQKGGILSATAKKLKVNDAIRAREVRLIDDEGNQVGVVATAEALSMAQEAGLDLVEVSPNVEPPVCKIIDYGKYMFELEKKTRESKKKQKIVKLKEIRMQPKIEDHDLEFKTKHVKEFLGEGDKVKVTIRFRGRELAHTHLGKDVLDDVLKLLGEDTYVLDKPATMEGRFMSMILSPKPKK